MLGYVKLTVPSRIAVTGTLNQWQKKEYQHQCSLHVHQRATQERLKMHRGRMWAQGAKRLSKMGCFLPQLSCKWSQPWIHVLGTWVVSCLVGFCFIKSHTQSSPCNLTEIIVTLWPHDFHEVIDMSLTRNVWHLDRDEAGHRSPSSLLNSSSSKSQAVKVCALCGQSPMLRESLSQTNWVTSELQMGAVNKFLKYPTHISTLLNTEASRTSHFCFNYGTLMW